MSNSGSKSQVATLKTGGVLQAFAEIEKCRSCNNSDLHSFLNLGRVPLANALVQATDENAQITFPLTVVFCTHCSLVQLKETVEPKLLFSDYPYFSSFSDTMLESARNLVEQVCQGRKLDTKSLVIEIGSNDGYLLKNYVAKQIPVLGIEPAQNIASVAIKNGINTKCEFFSLRLAEQLANQGLKADVFHGNNVVAHIPAVKENFAAISHILKDNGIAIIEVPYIKPLLDNKEFDTVYHEHIFYFSLTAIQNLAGPAGLTIRDVEEIAIHGGSLRITLSKETAQSPAVAALLHAEATWGVNLAETYDSLSARVLLLSRDLTEVLVRLKDKGLSIAAYGASAKGTTLLNYFDIGHLLNFVVDRSTVKQGRLTPGTLLPIKDPALLIQENIDYTLLLVWNFADEIFAQQIDYLKGGGAFIVPLPQLRIVRWNQDLGILQSTSI